MIRKQAEDAAGLTPGKDDNAVAGHLARRTPCNLDRNCCHKNFCDLFGQGNAVRRKTGATQEVRWYAAF